MAYDRHLIGPINSGLQTDLRPFMIPEDAFTTMQNAYVFRGRVTKRFGSSFMGTSQLTSRLRINIGTTDGSGNFAFTNLPGNLLNVGSAFSAGSIIFTVTIVPSVVGNQVTLSSDPGPGGPAVGTVRLDSTGPNIYQFKITGGQTSIATLPVYWYPAQPVMGIGIYESGPINNQPTFAFDQQFAYTWSSGWNQSTSTAVVASPPPYAGYPQWHGTDTNLFWIDNWQGNTDNAVNLYVSNFYTANPTLFSPSNGDATDDPIWYFDGTNWYPLSYSPDPTFTINPWNLQPLTVTQTTTSQVNVGTTTNMGAFSGTIPVGWIGEIITIGTQVFTVVTANGALSTIGAGSGTFNIATGALTITGAAHSTTIYVTYNNIPTNYVQSALIVIPFKNRLVLLNTIENNAAGVTDGYENDTQMDRQTSGITPTNYLTSTNTQFVNRCRYSHNGSPLANNAWLEPNVMYNPVPNQQNTNVPFFYPNTIADGGGYIDAPTSEAIVSAEFIKDRLIVGFENSTYELAYTGSEVLPFVWQKLNTEYGALSTFSSVPSDKIIWSIGNAGVMGCNGSNIERIDNKIPDEIWEIKGGNNDIKRVVGIRDYFAEQVYWTFTADDSMGNFPNQILQYNYKNGTWALIDDSFTFFGYFVQQSDLTWQDATDQWQNYNVAWNAGVTQQKYKQILAGNQEGFVLVINPELSRNAGSLQITNLTFTTLYGVSTGTVTAINHNLNDGDYILIENATGIANLNGYIYQIGYTDANTFFIHTNPQVPIEQPAFTGSYTGGGTIARVSNLNITSKQWNPYLGQGRNFYLSKIDFCVINSEESEDTSGEVTVDYFTSSAELSLVEEGQATNTIMGNSTLATGPYRSIPYEAQQNFLWHPLYFQADGEFVQIRIYMSDIQMLQPAISLADFEMDSLVMYTKSSSSRLQ